MAWIAGLAFLGLAAFAFWAYFKAPKTAAPKDAIRALPRKPIL
jgi:hypothetical protein